MASDIFNEASESVEHELSDRVSRLSEPNQLGFQSLKERQNRRREHLTAKLTEERGDRVVEYTNDLLNKKLTENELTLKPKGLGGESMDKMREQARKDADSRVDYEERQVLDRFDTRCVEAQYNYVVGAEHSEKFSKDFQGACHQNSNDKGNSR